ncbi:MAG: hypothetical protein ACTJLL_01725, partial [Anaplasma sp.]
TQPTGRELSFDRMAYDVNMHNSQQNSVTVEHDVIAIWQNKMLAAVVPLVFSIVGETDNIPGARTVWHIASKHDMYEIGNVDVGVYQTDNQGDGAPIILQPLHEYLAEPQLPSVPEYGLVLGYESDLEKAVNRGGADDFPETPKEPPAEEEKKSGVGAPSEDPEEDDSEEDEEEEEAKEGDSEDNGSKEEKPEEDDDSEEEDTEDNSEKEDAEEDDSEDDSEKDEYDDKTPEEPVPAEKEHEIEVPQNLPDVDYGRGFDVQRWSDDSKNIVSITEHHSPIHAGCYQPWVNAGYSDMLHFHENVNAKYQSQEYTYGQAMELYYSVTTEPCRYSSHSIFPIINGLVQPDGNMTVGQHPFGSLESFNEMFLPI